MIMHDDTHPGEREKEEVEEVEEVEEGGIVLRHECTHPVVHGQLHQHRGPRLGLDQNKRNLPTPHADYQRNAVGEQHAPSDR
jgi:hypothetical protein